VQRKKPIFPGQARKEQAPCHSTGAPFFLGEEAQCNQTTSRWPGPRGHAGNRLRPHAGNGRAHTQVIRIIAGTVGPLSRRTNHRAVPPGERRDLDRPRVARFRCPHPIWVTSRFSSSRLLKKARHLSPLPRRQRARRWRARALPAAYPAYASVGASRAALHLDLFEQPAENGCSHSPPWQAAEKGPPPHRRLRNTQPAPARPFRNPQSTFRNGARRLEPGPS